MEFFSEINSFCAKVSCGKGRNSYKNQTKARNFVEISNRLWYTEPAMELFFKNHDEKYAVEQILLTLFPDERPIYPEVLSGSGLSAAVSLSESREWRTAVTVLREEDRRWEGRARVRNGPVCDPVAAARLRQRILKQSFYRAAVRYRGGEKPPWGALSGVRPAKLLRGELAGCPDETAALRRFRERYDVSPDRARLCLDAAKAAIRAKDSLAPRDICLYVGVPFCPTRCAYCSFVSQSVEKSMALIPPFVDALEKDIAATAAAVRAAGLRPVAVYFGGGTPTTLSPAQLETVLTALERGFDFSAVREITVEAGRPDTVTAEKLAVLKAHGVTRVSVNPQTMSDRVLEAIGRKHTAADVLRALELVRSAGALQVNMDLIAGLPEDTVEGFRDTVEQVLALGAGNITVHTLALKKGSRITLDGTALPEGAEVGAMLSLARKKLTAAGYTPYYLYRQKYMSGGYENVGWCRPGTENLYNICVMEELCGVIAMGAGASTKLTLGDGRLRRFFAPKYPKEYIETIDSICAEKNRIQEGYHELFADGHQL